jgi:hypothetical protein
MPLLRRQLREQLPVVRANNVALGERLRSNRWAEGEPLPGGIAGLSPAASDPKGLGWFEAEFYGVASGAAVRLEMSASHWDLW